MPFRTARVSCALVLVVCLLAGTTRAQQSRATATHASEALDGIIAAAMQSGAYADVTDLSDRIGPRVTGSAAAAGATAWALQKMRVAGLKNAHVENWDMSRGWQRGFARAELIRPFQLPLDVVAYGWTGSTAGTVEAGIVPVDADAVADEIQNNSSRWADKILFVVARGARHMDGLTAFAELPKLAQTAARVHASAVIRRDPRPGVSLHTGPVGFGDASFAVPMLDIAPAQQLLLERLLNEGAAVRIRIEVQNTITRGAVISANVVGEIPGREHPEQVVIIGAHLDSWDLGTGAIDDGFGTAAVLGAARALAGSAPRRTIRFVLFTGEEEGLLGSRAYVEAHRAEMANVVCAFVLDWGQGPITAMPVAGHGEMLNALQELARALAPVQPLKITEGYLDFTDAYAFTLAGVPGIALYQQSEDYTTIGHSAADTLDKIDADVLARDTAVIAGSVWWVADLPDRVGEAWPPEKTAQVLTRDRQRRALEMLGMWPF